MSPNQSNPDFYRKRPTGSVELADPLLEERRSAHSTDVNKKKFRLSSKAFKAARNCDAQTWHVVQRTQALPPSSFAKSYFNDGNEWEAQLLSDDHRAIWIERFNQTFSENLPPTATFQDLAAQNKGSDENWRVNTRQAIEAVRLHLNTDVTQPLILAQVSMIPFKELENPKAPITQNGIADLVIWTGTHWNLGDIKLSEEAMFEHGAQVKLYRDLWESLLKGSDLPASMAPEGFVLHCANGFPYSSSLPDERKEEARQLCSIVPFTYEDLSEDYQQLMDKIEHYRENSPCPEPFFQKRCAECGYRGGCYPKLLRTDALSISLLPIPTSRAKALYASEISTLDTFIKQARSEAPPAIIDEISGNLPSIQDALIAKAAATRASAGYSNWRFPQPWLAKVVLFARVPKQGSVWIDQQGEQLDSPPKQAILIAYTEVERRIALAEAIEAGTRPSLSFSLQEDIQSSLHFPLPGWTLHEVAAWADQMQANQFNARFMANWNYASEEEQARLPDANTRSKALLTVWNTLLKLQANNQ